MTYRPLLERVGRSRLTEKPSYGPGYSGSGAAASRRNPRHQIGEFPLENMKEEIDKRGFHKLNDNPDLSITVKTDISVKDTSTNCAGKSQL